MATFYTFAVALMACACVPASRRLPDALPEVSGLALPRGGPVLALNDGGNPAIVYALDELGPKPADTFVVLDENVDWEALAYDTATGRLAVCDVGDNRRARDRVTVQTLSPPGKSVATFSLRYPDRPHDCEACLLRGDTLTLVTKARTLGGERARTAYVYRALLNRDTVLALVDSFTLRRRSVTDVTFVSPDTLAVLAYDFRLIGPLPLSRTSLYIGTWGDFRQNRARRIPIRAPFTLTQYEALANPRDNTRRLLIASERTAVFPQRFRWLDY